MFDGIANDGIPKVWNIQRQEYLTLNFLLGIHDNNASNTQRRNTQRRITQQGNVI